MYKTTAQDEFEIEQMVNLAGTRDPDDLPELLADMPARKARKIMVNRVIYAQLIEVVRAGRAEKRK